MPRKWEAVLSRSTVAPNFPALYAEVDSLFSSQPSGIVTYPDRHLVFRAFHETPPDKVRAVMIGQDPYPHELAVPDQKDPSRTGVADGLAFSARSVTPPESLQRILWNLWFTGELTSPPRDGNLVRWATQEGVLLLNSALTTASTSSAKGRKARDASLRRHMKIYKPLILSTLSHVARSQHRPGVILLGQHAQAFKPALSSLPQELIYSLSHPSRGPWPGPAQGQRPFSDLNSNLKQPIDWAL